MPTLHKELFPLIVQGKENKEIAAMYRKSESTINNRMQNLEIAYGANNKVGLIVNAIIKGDVTLEDLKKWSCTGPDGVRTRGRCLAGDSGGS